jgi:Sulfotransferase family
MSIVLILGLQRSGTTALFNTLCQELKGWNHPLKSALKHREPAQTTTDFYERPPDHTIRVSKETLGYERRFVDYIDQLPDKPFIKRLYLFRHPVHTYQSWITHLSGFNHLPNNFAEYVRAYKKLYTHYKSHPGGVAVVYENLVKQPRQQLNRLCQKLGIPFSPAMLHWKYAYKDNKNITYSDPCGKVRDQPKHKRVNASLCLQSTALDLNVPLSLHQQRVIQQELLPLYEQIKQEATP